MRITDKGSPPETAGVKLWKRVYGYGAEVRYYIEYPDGRMIVLNDGSIFDKKDLQHFKDYSRVYSVTIEVDP